MEWDEERQGVCSIPVVGHKDGMTRGIAAVVTLKQVCMSFGTLCCTFEHVVSRGLPVQFPNVNSLKLPNKDNFRDIVSVVQML